MRRKLSILTALLVMMLTCICSAAFGGEAQVTIKLDGISGREPTIEEIRDAAEAAARRAGAYVADVYYAISKASGMSCVLLKSDELTTDELIERLVVQPDVLSAVPEQVMRIESTAVPNDPDYADTDPVDKLWGLRAIRADEAWKRSIGDRDIYVAIIDSGINLDHEDLADNIADPKYWKNYVSEDIQDLGNGTQMITPGLLDPPDDDVKDTNGHGSHVAGTIGAVGNNGKGVVGVNWRVQMIPYRASGTSKAFARGGSGKAMNGILELLKEPDPPKIAAINMSFGSWTKAEPDEYLRRSVDGIALRAIDELPNAPLIAASAGNEKLEHTSKTTPRTYSGSSGTVTVEPGSYHYPSTVSRIPEIKNVISVAAIEKNIDGSYYGADYSNWSREFVDVAAPGSSIYSTIHSGEKAYGCMSGTSMAAPHVAGAAALLAARLEAEHRTWNGALLKDVLTKTANVSIDPPSDNSNGEPISKYGMIDLAAAMAALDTKITKIDIVIAPNDAERSLQVGSEATLTANFTPNGATVKKVSWDITEGDDVVSITPLSDDRSAKIRGEASGSATIRATAMDGSGVSGDITLTVTAAPHVHRFDDSIWESDGTYHWHECLDGDGAQSGRAAHSGGAWDTSAAGVHKKTCEVCQAPYAQGSHSAKSQSWERDGSEHWHICGDCGVKMDVSAHDDKGELKDDDPSDHWRLCSVCGEPQTKVKHSWSATLEYNAFKHMKRCQICGYQQTPGDDHSWSPSWESDKEKHWHKCSTPGCGAESTHEAHRDQKDDGVCDDCSAKVAHIHKGGDWQRGAGGHFKICTGCGQRYDEGTHSLDMLADGAAHWNSCSVCGYEDAHTPHAYSGWGHNALDHWQECSVCRKAGSMTAHSFGKDGICTVCAYFDASKVEAPAPVSPGPSDKIVDGWGAVWRRGSGKVRIVIDISWTLFVKITINGRELVEGAEYILDRPGTSGASGMKAKADEPTRIYLTEQLLGRLPAGEHTIKCTFAGEEDVDVSFTIAVSSDEMDRSAADGVSCASGAAAVAAAALAVALKRRR